MTKEQIRNRAAALQTLKGQVAALQEQIEVIEQSIKLDRHELRADAVVIEISGVEQILEKVTEVLGGLMGGVEIATSAIVDGGSLGVKRK